MHLYALVTIERPDHDRTNVGQRVCLCVTVCDVIIAKRNLDFMPWTLKRQTFLLYPFTYPYMIVISAAVTLLASGVTSLC